MYDGTRELIMPISVGSILSIISNFINEFYSYFLFYFGKPIPANSFYSFISFQLLIKNGGNVKQVYILITSLSGIHALTFYNSYNILLIKMAGKGKAGKKSVKRAQIKASAGNQTLTRGGIRRLARRGGIRRISDGVYSQVRDFAEYFLGIVVKDAAIFAENAKRKTITAMDIVYALKRSGRSLYGYGV